MYWTNFTLPNDLNCRKIDSKIFTTGGIELQKWHKIDLSTYKGEQRKDKMARNLVDYEAGKTILETAFGIIRKKDEKQTSIFDYL